MEAINQTESQLAAIHISSDLQTPSTAYDKLAYIRNHFGNPFPTDTSHFQHLPIELLLSITSYLDDHPVFSTCLSLTCRRFYSLFHTSRDSFATILRDGAAGPDRIYEERSSKIFLSKDGLCDWMLPHYIFYIQGPFNSPSEFVRFENVSIVSESKNADRLKLELGEGSLRLQLLVERISRWREAPWVRSHEELREIRRRLCVHFRDVVGEITEMARAAERMNFRWRPNLVKRVRKIRTRHKSALIDEEKVYTE